MAGVEGENGQNLLRCIWTFLEQAYDTYPALQMYL